MTVEHCCDLITNRHARGKDFSIVVVSEGYELHFESGESRRWSASADVDAFGHARLGGVGAALAVGDRASHRVRDARDDARPHPARRLADGARPGAGDALRAEGGRARARGRLGHDGRAARRRDRGRADRRRRRRAQARAARSSTTRRPSSSADRRARSPAGVAAQHVERRGDAVPLHPAAEDGGVHPGALERQHLVAVLDATLATATTLPAGTSSSSENVCSKSATSLPSRRFWIRKESGSSSSRTCSTSSSSATWTTTSSPSWAATICISANSSSSSVERLGDQDDAVGARRGGSRTADKGRSARPCAAPGGTSPRSPPARRRPARPGRPPRRPASARSPASASVTRSTKEISSPTTASVNGRIGVERIDGLLELGERPRAATLLQCPAAGRDHAVKRGHRPPVR